MRIGITFLSFGPDAFGGIERNIYNECKGLQACGADVVVYTSGAQAGYTTWNGIPMFISAYLPNSFPLSDLEIRRVLALHAESIRQELHDLVSSEAIDLIHSHDLLWGIVQPVEAWRALNIPLVLSFEVLNEPQDLDIASKAPWALRTCVSPFLCQQIQSVFPKCFDDLVILPNTVDTDLFYPRIRAWPSPQPRSLWSNARLDAGKGVFTLIEAFEQVGHHIQDVELWLSGGEYAFFTPYGGWFETERRVREIVSSSPLSSRIRILPRLRWSEIPSILHRSTIVVLPTWAETFGIAALETLATGTPLVTTRVGNLPFLVQDAAILVKPGSVEELVDGITVALCDEATSHYAWTRGPKIARTYDSRSVASHFLAMCRSL